VTDSLLTVRQVADALGFSTETILRWNRRGEFEGVVIRLPGGRLRFREDRLDAWIEERATTERGSERGGLKCPST
jgi:excisionase family DNA binding protein